MESSDGFRVYIYFHPDGDAGSLHPANHSAIGNGLLVGAVLPLGTTEAVSDLGSDGKVQVRFRSASSFLGVEPSVALIYDEIESGSPVSVEEMLFLENCWELLRWWLVSVIHHE